MDRLTRRNVFGISESADECFLALGIDLISLAESDITIHAENLIHLASVDWPIHFSGFNIRRDNFPKRDALRNHPIAQCKNRRTKKELWIPLLDVETLVTVLLHI